MPDHSAAGPLIPLNGLMVLVLIVLIVSIVLSCGMGRYSNAGSPPLTLEALYAQCGLPASCDAPLTCDGRTVTLVALLDPVNIFDRRQFPRLPYEKFTLTDGDGRSVEVWAQAADNSPIFDKLAARPSDRIIVRGRLAGVKMPAMGKCNQGIKVLIDAADQIEF